MIKCGYATCQIVKDAVCCYECKEKNSCPYRCSLFDDCDDDQPDLILKRCERAISISDN